MTRTNGQRGRKRRNGGNQGYLRKFANQTEAMMRKLRSNQTRYSTSAPDLQHGEANRAGDEEGATGILPANKERGTIWSASVQVVDPIAE